MEGGLIHLGTVTRHLSVIPKDSVGGVNTTADEVNTITLYVHGYGYIYM